MSTWPSFICSTQVCSLHSAGVDGDVDLAAGILLQVGLQDRLHALAQGPDGRRGAADRQLHLVLCRNALRREPRRQRHANQ
jgi:hypothetical protein